MLPPWMIERLEQDRREREAQEQDRVELEIQPSRDVPPRPDRPAPASTSVVTIQVW